MHAQQSSCLLLAHSARCIDCAYDWKNVGLPLFPVSCESLNRCIRNKASQDFFSSNRKAYPSRLLEPSYILIFVCFYRRQCVRSILVTSILFHISIVNSSLLCNIQKKKEPRWVENGSKASWVRVMARLTVGQKQWSNHRLWALLTGPHVAWTHSCTRPKESRPKESLEPVARFM